MVIKTGTSGKVDVKGVSDIKFQLEGISYKHPFYICGDARNPIIGFDFQQKYDMYLRPAENALYIGKKKMPCFDHSTFWGKAKVTMYQEFTIEPQHEALVQGKVLQRKVNHNNKLCVVDKVASCHRKDGCVSLQNDSQSEPRPDSCATDEYNVAEDHNQERFNTRAT